MSKKSKWAYLGEVPVEQFGKLVANFAEIVGIGTVEREGETLIVCGVSMGLDDKAIDIYQLVVSLWGADDTTMEDVSSIFFG